MLGPYSVSSQERRGSWSLTPLGHGALFLANGATGDPCRGKRRLPLPRLHLPVAPWLWSLVVAGGQARCRQAVHTAAVHNSQTPRQLPGAKRMFQDSLESLGALRSLFALKAGFQAPGGFSCCPPFSHYFKQLASLVGRGDRNVFGPPTLLPFSSSVALLSPGFPLQLLNLKGATSPLEGNERKPGPGVESAV